MCHKTQAPPKRYTTREQVRELNHSTSRLALGIEPTVNSPAITEAFSAVYNTLPVQKRVAYGNLILRRMR